MEQNQSTERTTVVPAALYDQMLAETSTEPDEALQRAAVRARELIVRKG